MADYLWLIFLVLSMGTGLYLSYLFTDWVELYFVSEYGSDDLSLGLEIVRWVSMLLAMLTGLMLGPIVTLAVVIFICLL
jgi:hypothetical protein